jgi:hypothetical protein
MSNNRISSLGVTSSLFSSFLIVLHSKIGGPFCFSLSLSLSLLFLWRKGATVGSCYKHAVCMGNLPMRIVCRSCCMTMSGTTRTTSRHLVVKFVVAFFSCQEATRKLAKVCRTSDDGIRLESHAMPNPNLQLLLF